LRARPGFLFGFVVLLTSPVLADSAAAQPALECRGALKPMMVADLLFGRGHVGEAAWRRFVVREITPRFPEGLTIFDARGQWRDPARGVLRRERSKVVTIAVPAGAADDDRLQRIVAAYKSRFRQQSVGVIVRSACGSF
jgi:hypothetical protein